MSYGLHSFSKKNERIENKKVASDGRELVEIFNGYFWNIVWNLLHCPPNTTLHHDPVWKKSKNKNWEPPKVARNRKASSVRCSFSIFIQERHLKWSY